MSLRSTVERFSGLRVLVIGDAFLDQYIEGTSGRGCPDAPDAPVVDRLSCHDYPGGAANVAQNAKALGAKEVLLVEGAIRQIKTRIIADGRLVARIDSPRKPLVEADDFVVAARLASHWPESDLVIVSDYGKGVMSPAVIAEMAALQAENPKILVIDSKDLAKYRECRPTAVTPNVEEHDWFTFPDCDPLWAVTHDKDGVWFFRNGDGSGHVPAPKIDPAYPSGAGDTFAVALGLALASGATDREAVEIAVKAASVVVAKPHTATCSAAELLALFPEPERARTVVLASGCFDVLHAGHVALLEHAKSLGDELVVAINSDESIGRLKGRGRPVNGLEARWAALESLPCVDRVVYFAADDPWGVILAIKPDFYVKGSDYSRRTLPEAIAVEQNGGKVVFFPRIEGLSTTQTIKRACGCQCDPNSTSRPGPSCHPLPTSESAIGSTPESRGDAAVKPSSIKTRSAMTAKFVAY